MNKTSDRMESSWSTKQWLLLLPYFLLWLVILLFQGNERLRYQVGKNRGMNCTGSKDVSWLIYGTTTEYTFDPNTPPTKYYLTWRKFWSERGYCKPEKA